MKRFVYLLVTILFLMSFCITGCKDPAGQSTSFQTAFDQLTGNIVDDTVSVSKSDCDNVLLPQNNSYNDYDISDLDVWVFCDFYISDTDIGTYMNVPGTPTYGSLITNE